MAKYLPSITWRFWRDRRAPRYGRVRQGDVSTASKTDLRIRLDFGDGPGDEFYLILNRSDARMLARRVLQCLDGSK